MTTKAKIKKSEINPGQAKSYSLGNTKIVVCNVNNEYFALEDVCSHDEGELVSGEGALIENCQLECPRHGARFDVKTGEAKKMPAVGAIKTYGVNLVGDELQIEIEKDER